MINSRVLILTQYYLPEMGAPQARLSELAQGLKKWGHSVTILTAMANYPTGKIFPKYRGQWYCKEIIDDIVVHRAFIVPDNSRNFLKRLGSYFSFVFSSIWVALVKLGHVNTLILESPPLFLGLSAVLLSKIKRAKLIVNVSDLWPESAIRMGMVKNSTLIFISRHLEKWLYRQAFQITGQSPTIVATIKSISPASQVSLLSNGADCQRFSATKRNEEFREMLGLKSNDIGIIYAGLLGIAQGIEQIIKAAINLRNDKKIHFYLVGDGPVRSEIEDEIRQLRLSNIHLLGLKPRSEIPELLASMDIALITLGANLPGAVPSKIYEAMASELPVVLVAEGDAKEIIEKSAAGIVCELNQVKSLVLALKTLSESESQRKAYGENGRRAVLEKYDRKHSIQALHEIIQT